MPELPEVETVRTGLEKAWVGHTITAVELRRQSLRFPFPKDMVERLQGRKIIAIRRRAKYLLIDLDDGSIWLNHLGMTGRWTYDASDYDGKHDHVMIRFEDGSVSVYNDPRRFGVMDIMVGTSHKLLDHLGPEPLEDWSGAELANRLSGRKSAIKTLLLDQRIVVGIGNIYACEVLNRAQISPTRKGGDVSEHECRLLVTESRKVLLEAIAVGGSTLKDFKAVDGSLGYFPHQFRVYDKEREQCPCGGIVERFMQGGRSTFWCSSCQD
jgi:formamidopyrimidine-DNA glycosylase